MSCTGSLAFPIPPTFPPLTPKLPVCATAYKLFPYQLLRSAGDLKICSSNISQMKTTEGRSYPRTQSEHGARARSLVQETRILDSPPKTVVGRPTVSMLGVYSALTSFPSHNRLSPQFTNSPTSRSGGSVRSVPSSLQDVQGCFRAAAGPCVLTFGLDFSPPPAATTLGPLFVPLRGQGSTGPCGPSGPSGPRSPG